MQQKKHLPFRRCFFCKKPDCFAQAYITKITNQVSTVSQIKQLEPNWIFHNQYFAEIIPLATENDIIYCDPPYEGTTKYKDDFNHVVFWQWCRDMASKGHIIFVSEYNAPNDFECVWQKEIVSSLTQDTGSKKAVEKLFKFSPTNVQ